MVWDFFSILLGAMVGGYFGYCIQRKYRIQNDSADARIGDMIHISEGLNGYLERKINASATRDNYQ